MKGDHVEFNSGWQEQRKDCCKDLDLRFQEGKENSFMIGAKVAKSRDRGLCPTRQHQRILEMASTSMASD
jgi:hypothetical protein